MPSREIRRVNQKKTAEKAPSGEEKKKKKSFLYIFSLVLLVLIIVTFIGVPVVGNAGRSQGRVIFGTFAGKNIEFIYGNFFSNQSTTGTKMYASASPTAKGRTTSLKP